MANELDYLKILQNHLIKTGFEEHFNIFINKPVLSIEYIQDENILRYSTNTNTFDVPFDIKLDNLYNVGLSDSTSGS